VLQDSLTSGRWRGSEKWVGPVVVVGQLFWDILPTSDLPDCVDPRTLAAMVEQLLCHIQVVILLYQAVAAQCRKQQGATGTSSHWQQSHRLAVSQ
jgi:hypothetical protein